MELVMCEACGEFVSAVERGGEWTAALDECPACGGDSFTRVD